jgi:hypothetical protein
MPADYLKLQQRDADLRRIRGLLSRSNHMNAAFCVLSGLGLYMALARGRILVAFALIVAANALLVWSLDLMSRARLLIKRHERELRNG